MFNESNNNCNKFPNTNHPKRVIQSNKVNSTSPTAIKILLQSKVSYTPAKKLILFKSFYIASKTFNYANLSHKNSLNDNKKEHRKQKKFLP